jgi:hypothetical protein
MMSLLSFVARALLLALPLMTLHFALPAHRCQERRDVQSNYVAGDEERGMLEREGAP